MRWVKPLQLALCVQCCGLFFCVVCIVVCFGWLGFLVLSFLIGFIWCCLGVEVGEVGDASVWDEDSSSDVLCVYCGCECVVCGCFVDEVAD